MIISKSSALGLNVPLFLEKQTNKLWATSGENQTVSGQTLVFADLNNLVQIKIVRSPEAQEDDQSRAGDEGLFGAAVAGNIDGNPGQEIGPADYSLLGFAFSSSSADSMSGDSLAVVNLYFKDRKTIIVAVDNIGFRVLLGSLEKARSAADSKAQKPSIQTGSAPAALEEETLQRASRYRNGAHAVLLVLCTASPFVLRSFLEHSHTWPHAPESVKVLVEYLPWLVLPILVWIAYYFAFKKSQGKSGDL